MVEQVTNALVVTLPFLHALVADFLGLTLALNLHNERSMPVAVDPCVHEHLVCDALEQLCRGYLIVADGHAWVVFARSLLVLIEGVCFLLFLCPAPAEDEQGKVLSYKDPFLV